MNKPVKHYTIAIFSQDECKPCRDLKEHVRNLPQDQQSVLNFYDMKNLRGQQTVWCETLDVNLTPTMVVLHNEDYGTPIEKVVGCKSIIELLPSTITNYTYVHTEIDNIHPDQSNAENERNRS